MFSFTNVKNPRKIVKNLQDFCDQYFGEALFLEETKFDSLFLENNSFEFQQLVSFYDQTFSLFLFCHLKKFLSQEEISQPTFSFFLKKYKERTAEDLSFLEQQNKPNNRTFSSNTKTYQILLRVWSLFTECSLEIFLTKRIRAANTLLKTKIEKFSAFTSSDSPLTDHEKKSLLVWYNFYFLFIIQVLYSRQKLSVFAQSLSKDSIFYFGAIEILFCSDYEILNYLSTLVEYSCLSQKLLKKSKMIS